jgi:thiamine-phosphate pyrophosphorylase
LQLRAKSCGAGATLALLRELRAACAAHGVPLFANDRPDLARLADCEGVHVGQGDLSVADVRAVAPGLRVGVSTHDLAQVRGALSLRPSYVALGPLFATSSKTNPDPVVDAATLREASTLCRGAGVPLVGIGGISLERAAGLTERLDAVAVISALLPADPRAAGSVASQLIELWS